MYVYENFKYKTQELSPFMNGNSLFINSVGNFIDSQS